MEVTPNPLIKAMSGKVFGHKEKISMRMHYGKLRSYTYQNKPEEWSEAQTQMRRLFGAAAYMGRLVLKIEEAKAHFEQVRRKEKFARMDNFVAKQVTAVCKEDAELRGQVIAANEAHKKVKGQKSKEEELQTEQMALAELLWSRMR